LIETNPRANERRSTGAREMGKRRFAQVATSDEEEEEEPRSKASASREKRRERSNGREKRRKELDDESDEDDDGAVEEENDEKSEPEEEQEPERENVQEDAKVIGDIIKVTGKGKRKKSHYASFEFDGNVFELVLFFSEFLV
jgi:hypothetical protein